MMSGILWLYVVLFLYFLGWNYLNCVEVHTLNQYIQFIILYKIKTVKSYS